MEKQEKAVLILRVLAVTRPLPDSRIWMRINDEEKIQQSAVRLMLEMELEPLGHVTRSGAPRRWEITPRGREWLQENDKERE